MIHPVILAGGSGSRLWPESRELFPKQFLTLFENEHSLFQQTALRCTNFSQPIIICNEEHRFLVAEQLRQINITPQAILLEPEGKNTAPAIMLAALYIDTPEDWLLVMPADQNIDTSDELIDLVNAHANDKSDGLITFGIETTSPNTGYGYIRRAITPKLSQEHAIEEFIEKPNETKAKELDKDINVFWNSGIFLFKQTSFIKEINLHLPAIHKTCSEALSLAKTDLDFIRIDAGAFSKCPNISVDYAIMEHTLSATMLPFRTPWNDVGVWSSIWDVSAKDKDENVISGDVIAIDTSNSLIRSSNRLVATLGIHNQIIVETADAILIADKSQSQNVKQLTAQLKQKKRSEISHHRKVYRPWGWYESLSTGKHYQVKLICVNTNGCLSLQKHMKRSEHWVIVSGEAIVTNGDDTKVFSVNESTYIPAGNIHRLENKSSEPLLLIEVQTGNYFGEDDIIRLDDRYGREK
jgi:mannose-1-phosphate guanylyltransferase/mannose-6-phosphate isomerase